MNQHDETQTQLMQDNDQPYRAYRLRVVRERIAEPVGTMTSADAVARWAQHLVHYDREHLIRLDLDVKCRVIGVETVHVGTLDSVQISPRELFRGALLSGAASIIVLHNHPSGSSEPSVEDEQVAERLADAGRLLHVQVLDFLVIGDGGRYWSHARGYGQVPPRPADQAPLAAFAVGEKN